LAILGAVVAEDFLYIWLAVYDCFPLSGLLPGDGYLVGQLLAELTRFFISN
jgi:hypothetical protein